MELSLLAQMLLYCLANLFAPYHVLVCVPSNLTWRNPDTVQKFNRHVKRINTPHDIARFIFVKPAGFLVKVSPLIYFARYPPASIRAPAIKLNHRNRIFIALDYPFEIYIASLRRYVAHADSCNADSLHELLFVRVNSIKPVHQVIAETRSRRISQCE